MNGKTLRGILGIILASILVIVIIQNVVSPDKSTETIQADNTIEKPISQTPQPIQIPKVTCDPSYPELCIPFDSPDLNCDDIPHTNFKVVGNDKHRFDGDKDGIGCES